MFLGRLVTNIGDSLYLIGAMWLVYNLTGSSFYTGIAGFLVQLPTSVQFLYGPLVDRWDLRRTLVATQVVQCVCVLIVPLAAAVGYLSVWIVLLIMSLLSLLNQFVYPAHSAALPRIVDDEQLVQANSLFTSAYQGSEVVFNAIGGIVIAIVGAVTLFAIDSITFAVAALLFLRLEIPSIEEENAESKGEENSEPEDVENEEESSQKSHELENTEDTDADDSYVDELREGFDYLRGSIILSMILGAVVANFGFGAMLAVMPAFADSFGGAETFGLLMAALAGGQLVGAVGASVIEDVAYGQFSVVALMFTGIGLAGMVFVPGRLPTVGLLFVATIPVGMFNVMFFSLLQSSVDSAFLGRVTSMVSSVTTVMIPIGSLLGGFIAEAFSPEIVLYGLAGLIVLNGLYFLAHPKIRGLPSVSETDAVTLGLRNLSDS